ncbi:hypothetical protein DFJ74DRAFT_686236 [Hyaloraphidium curvatum]|nr:hypothetical protein DFJ74DRAFT_686236 [Hyaloraphidium curvatum]
MPASDPVSLPFLPSSASWHPSPPASFRALPDGFSATAPPSTDLFRSPLGKPESSSAPRLLFPAPEGDWTLAADVDVAFRGDFDAGCLVLFRGDSYAKLCVERSPAGEATLVSVVTNAVSDDATAFVVPRSAARLRVARVGPGFAFHVLGEDKRWIFLRQFALQGEGQLQAGFLVQSPKGPSCEVVFRGVSFSMETLKDMRSGV